MSGSVAMVPECMQETHLRLLQSSSNSANSGTPRDQALMMPVWYFPSTSPCSAPGSNKNVYSCGFQDRLLKVALLLSREMRLSLMCFVAELHQEEVHALCFASQPTSEHLASTLRPHTRCIAAPQSLHFCALQSWRRRGTDGYTEKEVCNVGV